ncbi:MAG: GNAT family N-acetyltransferase [Firmicutes bacterium]|nr:GNAT family N-acetyltransferase [Bacillota bacterium]
MDIQPCTKADFDQIVTEIADFWGSDRTLPLHHPIFLYEFGDTAWVMRDGDRVAGYLFGFVAATSPTAYVHLVAVRSGYRERGVPRRLYARFIDEARRRGARQLKAITTPGNRESVAFHTRLGMRLLGEPGPDGIPVVRNYSGPGQDRVVMIMHL